MLKGFVKRLLGNKRPSKFFIDHHGMVKGYYMKVGK